MPRHHNQSQSEPMTVSCRFDHLQKVVEPDAHGLLHAGGIITFVQDSATPATTTFDGSVWRTTVPACQVTD